MSRPSWIGKSLSGRYRIDELLGQGGMSAVYKAYDPNLRRVVAIKMIHGHLADDPKFLVRFEEEAAAVAQLRHPNIVQVFDFNHDGDDYYMVQEFIPGETLQERLRHLNKSSARMPVQEALRYTANICEAAGYAHLRGMIHRDIKPANIMLDVHGKAILMDFGIVKITGSQQHTATGAVLGTALYLPPEVIRGEAPDQRSDIYSLGVTLFEMVSGKPPFESDSAMSLMMRHLNDPVPDLRQLRPEIPESLIAVIEKALQKERNHRYGSMEEMASALVAASIEDRPRPADTPTLAESAVVLEATQVEEVQSNAPPPPAPPAQVPLVSSAFLPPDSTGDSAGAVGVGAGSVASVGVTTDEGRSPGKSSRGVLPWAIAAGVVLVLVIVGGLIYSRMNGNGTDPSGGLAAAPSGTTAAAALLPVVTTATLETGSSIESSPTQTPPPSATQTPTVTPTLPPSQTPTTTATPTPTIPVGLPFSLINGIAIDNQQRYIVDFETFVIPEDLTSQHVHFFFSTVPPEQAGRPGQGPWVVWYTPHLFDGYRVNDRPQFATQMCILVANHDHSVQLNSGNCVVLPDVPVATALLDTACRQGPDPSFGTLTTLAAGDTALVQGISPDEQWWNVSNPQNTAESCWLLQRETGFSGDISVLPLVEPPPLPEGQSPSNLFVEIQSISLDEQSRYVVTYIAQGFTEQLPGTHMHFYFNTVPEDQIGQTGTGQRLMFGGPTPFTGYNASDRPTDATEMCVRVANPDHSIIPNSGNCFKLPDVP